MTVGLTKILKKQGPPPPTASVLLDITNILSRIWMDLSRGSKMGVDELAIACKMDKRNIETLWLSVYRLIRLWASKYCKVDNNRYDKSDLIQSAYFALLKAVEAYTADRGYKFVTYLNYHCRNEFAAVIGIRTSKREPRILSLDAPTGKDTEDITLADSLPNEQAAEEMDRVIDNVYNDQLHNALDMALQTLPDKKKQVIYMRYYEGLTLKESADKLGVNNIERAR
jgi:RNA polymerase sporulation-specific sigma factor